MCGRYTLSRPPQIVSQLLKRRIQGELHLPVYNASPGQHLPVVLDRNPQWIVPALWGMRLGGRSQQARLVINARAETVHQRPMFRESFRRRRCLVIADGFYEWQKIHGARQPYRIRLLDGDLFAFAGIWMEVGGEPAYVILTTEPNRVTRPIHDRMPVILEMHEREAWLDPELATHEVLKLLNPFPEDQLIAYPVSRAVNNSRNDGPELIEPLDMSGGSKES